MKRKLWHAVKIGLVGLGSLLAVASLGLVWILQVWPSDNFKFLGGRNPVIAGMKTPMQVCFANPPHESSAQEYRIYSWEQKYGVVMAMADQELRQLGFTRHAKLKQDESFTAWVRGEGEMVWMQPGRSRTRREAGGGKGSKDPRWVTAIYSRDAPDTWITHVRFAFDPDDW